MNSGNAPWPATKHIDTSPRFIAVDLRRQLLPGTFEHALQSPDRPRTRSVPLRRPLQQRPDRRLRLPAGHAAQGHPVRLQPRASSAAAASSAPAANTSPSSPCRRQRPALHHPRRLRLHPGRRHRPAVRPSALPLRPARPDRPRDVRHRRRQAAQQRQSKARSGTRADFARQADKLEAAAQKPCSPATAQNDALPVEPDLAEKARQRIERLQREAAQLRQWLSRPPGRSQGRQGQHPQEQPHRQRIAPRWPPARASSRAIPAWPPSMPGTRSSSKRRPTAPASEQELLMPVVEATAPQCHARTRLITADAGYHSDANLKALAEAGDRPALIADNGMRKRDERFKDQGKYKAQPDPLYDKAHPKKAARHYRPQGLRLRPGGRHLHLPGRQVALPERRELQPQRPSGREVPGRAARLRAVRPARQMPAHAGEDQDPAGRVSSAARPIQTAESYTRPDEAGHRHRNEGERCYGRRFATVEPVFGNLRHNKRLNRFTLRGRKKVDAQWKLYLPGAQHREAGASRVCAVGKREGNPSVKRLPPSQKAGCSDCSVQMHEKAKWRRENRAIFVPEIRLEKGFSTASTCKLRGAKPACRRSVPLERKIRH